MGYYRWEGSSPAWGAAGSQYVCLIGTRLPSVCPGDAVIIKAYFSWKVYESGLCVHFPKAL